MNHDMDIISMAFELTAAMDALYEHAREFYYAVMLSGHTCPVCDGTLLMISESRCRCQGCGEVFDPTVAYQRCTTCGGSPKLRICRYQCRRCGRDIASRFAFDGRVFDREYFRRKMIECRKRKKQEHAENSSWTSVDRSAPADAPPTELSSIPGLSEALDDLVGMPELRAWLPLATGFDLNRYQTHLQAHIGPIEVSFDDLPPLESDTRMDRIWRFVAIIFMAHAGLLEVWQDARTIWVRTNEADAQGY